MGTDRTRTALLGTVLLAALALGVALLLLAPGADRPLAGGRAVPVLIVAIGWAFVAVGWSAWRRRPDNRTGALLAVFGLTVLLSGLVIADAALPYLALGDRRPARDRGLHPPAALVPVRTARGPGVPARRRRRRTSPCSAPSR